MKGMKRLLSIFVVLAFVAISSTAFADGMRSKVYSEAGVEVIPSAKALAAARSHTYDHFDSAYLDALDSEAGAEVIPSARAIAASQFYQYDKSKMASVSDSISQSLYFASDHQSTEVHMLVDRAAADSLICTTC